MVIEVSEMDVYSVQVLREVEIVLLGLLLWCAALGQENAASTFRVLVVGDSWSDYMIQDGVLNDTFADNGYNHALVKGDVTAISGTTAEDWTTPANLTLITNELNANPSIEIVQLTMGGNDFLAGQSGGGWFLGMSTVEEEALFDRVAEDVETVIDHILSIDPDMKIVLSFYDYANFVETLSGLGAIVCVPLHNDLGQPDPLELNEVQTRFSSRIMALADGWASVEAVDHMGSMQFTFGYPSMGIEPGELLPPGDLSLPSPPESLRFGGIDCFHLNPAGYRILAENLWEQYYVANLCLTQVIYDQNQAHWPEPDILNLIDDLGRLCTE